MPIWGIPQSFWRQVLWNRQIEVKKAFFDGVGFASKGLYQHNRGVDLTGQRVGYCRVSSADQNTSRQLDGIATEKLFTDKASGKDTERPELKLMLDYVREGDVVFVHSMDRLARNLIDLRQLVERLTKKGVKVTFVKEGLTFNGEDAPMSIMMLTMMGAVAEFERAMILERQREGIAQAKARGAYKGRKPSLTCNQVAQLRQRAEAGEKKAVLAREFEISRETVYTYLRAPES